MLWRQVAARSGSSQTIPRRGGICCATAWRCLTTAGHWGAPTATRGASGRSRCSPRSCWSARSASFSPSHLRGVL